MGKRMLSILLALCILWGQIIWSNTLAYANDNVVSEVTEDDSNIIRREGTFNEITYNIEVQRITSEDLRVKVSAKDKEGKDVYISVSTGESFEYGVSLAREINELDTKMNLSRFRGQKARLYFCFLYDDTFYWSNYNSSYAEYIDLDIASDVTEDDSNIIRREGTINGLTYSLEIQGNNRLTNGDLRVKVSAKDKDGKDVRIAIQSEEFDCSTYPVAHGINEVDTKMDLSWDKGNKVKMFFSF